MENLEDIKVGDKVIVTNSFYKKVETVSRVTKSLIIVGNKRFKKSNGWECGGFGYRSPWIKVATPELIASIEEENKRINLIEKVRNYPFYKLSTDELEKVYELINK